MSILEKIKTIEEEIAKTQKNKATEKHLGILKAKLAKLKQSLISPKGRSGGHGFSISKSGDATVAIIGFPSVGKSTLLNRITNAETKTGHYAFTTLNVVPGILKYNGANIQILDLPGIIEGARSSKGRGREIISVARNADLLLIVLEPFSPEKDYKSIMRELTAMGIRLNTEPPNVYIEKKHTGGIDVVSSKKITKITPETIKAILNTYGIHNATVILQEDVDIDRFIDAIEKNRVYMPAIVVINKIDLAPKERVKEIKEKFPDALLVSGEKNIGIEELKEAIYKKLKFIRIYTKPINGKPDFNEPLMLREGATVREACQKIHRDLVKHFKYAKIWGKSAKFPGQRVGIDHILKDGDIITIISK